MGRFILYQIEGVGLPQLVVGHVFAASASPPRWRVALATGAVWGPSGNCHQAAHGAFLDQTFLRRCLGSPIEGDAARSPRTARQRSLSPLTPTATDSATPSRRPFQAQLVPCAAVAAAAARFRIHAGWNLGAVPPPRADGPPDGRGVIDRVPALDCLGAVSKANAYPRQQGT